MPLRMRTSVVMNHSLSMVLLSVTFACMAGIGTEAVVSSWQDCESFFAPSSLPTGGWGIFAARDFDAWEIVDISPLFIPMDYFSPTIRDTVLDDYIYGYHRWHALEREIESLACVAFGNAMFYNHHTEPNVKWFTFGREPNEQEPHIAQANGFVARRKIFAGEELFSSYGEEDGGKRWFQNRNLSMLTIPSKMSLRNGTGYQQDKLKYCSKIYAGIGQPTWTNRIQGSIFPGVKVPFTLDVNRLPSEDHPGAVSKHDVKSGTVLETVPALVLSKASVVNTALAPTCFFWNDWNPQQKQALRDLRERRDLRVHRQNGSLILHDNFSRFEDFVVLPVAGSIAMVDRVGKSRVANCEIKILASGSLQSYDYFGGTTRSAGILLRLVATTDIKTGDRLAVNLENMATPAERKLLATVLAQTGNRAPNYLQGELTYEFVGDEL